MNAKAPDYDCPATGFKKKCSKLRDNCPKWVFVDGKHPQTEEVIRRFDCVDAWLSVLLVDNFRITEQVVGSIDLARKEHIDGVNQQNGILAMMAHRQMEALETAARPEKAIEINGSKEGENGRGLDHS